MKPTLCLLILTAAGLSGCAQLPVNVEATSPPASGSEPAGNKDNILDQKIRDNISAPLRRPHEVLELEIGYHQISGLNPGQSAWHILDTSWWVQLHHQSGVMDMDKLDKTNKLTGIALAQSYGVIHVWVLAPLEMLRTDPVRP